MRGLDFSILVQKALLAGLLETCILEHWKYRMITMKVRAILVKMVLEGFV